MSTQPRKPAGSPNSTGGQYDVNPSANVSLPALVPPPAANSVRRTLPARAPARVWSETGGVRQRNQASDPDPHIRFQLACNPYADRLVLADLAGDDNVRVRRAVAYNRAVSNKVLRRLLDDPDARVRSNAIEQAGMRDDLEESTIKRMLAEDRPRTIRLLLSGRQLLFWRQQREIIAGLPHRWPWQRGCNRVLSLLLSAHQMMLR